MSPPPSPNAAQLYEQDVTDGDGARITTDPCPVCDETQATRRFAVERIETPVVVCETCGLGRFHPMLGPEEIRGLYPDEYYGEPGVKFQPLVERLVRWVGERHISFLCRGLDPGARVLDVGCGRGVILGPLADRGFEVHGVEISAEAARGADPRAEIRIAPTLRDADYPEAFFDEIVIWHVLEHLADPRATVEEMHRILKPGGRLVVAVPNFESLQARWSGNAWFHLDLPRHLYQFPLSGLRQLLERVGFHPESDHHFSLRQNPYGWIQSAMNRGHAFPRNALYTLLHRRGADEAPPYATGLRLRLFALGALMVPLALAATVVETLLRSGATVHVVATRSPGASATSRADA